MSDPAGAYNIDSDGYHGNPAGDYHGNPAGGYHREIPGGGYDGDHDDEYGDAAAGGYHGDGYHSDGEFESRREGDDPHGFRTLQPEETNAGLTEMINTPRQHLDTSGEWLSADRTGELEPAACVSW